MLAAIISAMASLTASVIGYFSSKSNQDSAIEAQREENQKQREYATEEWNRQQAAINEYNTPAAQNERLEAAGINPAVYWEKGTSSVASQGSPSLAPSGSSLNVPDLGMSNAIAGMVSAPEKVADTLNKLYEAKARSVSNKNQQRQIDAEIANITAQAHNSELDSSLKEFDLEMQQTFGRKIKAAEVENAIAQYKLAYAQASLAVKNGEKVDMEKLNIAEDTLLKASQRVLNSRQSDILKVDLQYRGKQLQSQINANNASAAYQSAQARSENEFRATRGQLLGLEYAIKNNEAEISDRTTEIRVLDALEHFKTDRYVTQQALEDYLHKKYSNDTRGIKDIMNVFYNFIPFGGSFKE